MEMNSIQLFARDASRLGGTLYEAIVIQMADGKKVRLLDSYYRNMPEIKRAIRDWYGELVEPLPKRGKKTSPSPVYDPEFGPPMDQFSGNYFTSGNGIMFWLFTSGLGLLVVTHLSFLADSWWALLIILPFAIFYFGFGGQLFYFNVSDECLEVKNHLFFWYTRRYAIDDIISVVVEAPYKRSTSLRIRTKEMDSRSFSAGSLRDVDWKALVERLKGLGIAVVNELT